MYKYFSVQPRIVDVDIGETSYENMHFFRTFMHLFAPFAQYYIIKKRTSFGMFDSILSGLGRNKLEDACCSA